MTGQLPRIWTSLTFGWKVSGVRALLPVINLDTYPPMKPYYFTGLPLAMVALAAVSPSLWAADRQSNAMSFFEGRTESLSTIKLMMKKPYKSRSIGRGEIKADGSLHLLQRVEDEGKPAHDRRWHIREIEPGRFIGTMSEAKGPVAIEEVGGRYRFRFKMKGNVSVEQWVTPLPGGRTANSKVTIRKMGITVGQSEGTIRRLDH